MTRDFTELICVATKRCMHIHMICAYHRRYPEARGQGCSLHEATKHLIGQLTRSLDHVHDPRRQAVERAIADVRAFRLTSA